MKAKPKPFVKHVLLETDLGRDLGRRTAAQFMTIPSVPVRVVVEIPGDALAVLQKDPALVQRFYDAPARIRDQCLSVLAERLAICDNAVGAAAVAAAGGKKKDATAKKPASNSTKTSRERPNSLKASVRRKLWPPGSGSLRPRATIKLTKSRSR